MPIYLGARDLNGVFVGTHQFIVIVSNTLLTPRDVAGQSVKAQHLGKKDQKDIYGLVFGAQNRGTLNVEFFESADLTATKEYFGGIATSWNKSDFDAEMYGVDFGKTDEAVAIDALLYRVMAYIYNQRTDPITYPTAGFGYNSNSWAQSVIQYAGGKVTDDVDGVDVGSSKRIPKTYFDAVCTIKPRPKLN